MPEFFCFLKVFVLCGAGIFIAMLVLLAMPQSRLRCVGLEMAKWTMAVGFLVLLPSPVDVIPDVLPVVGWADDVGYLLASVGAVKSALGERKKRRLYEEIELKELQAKVEE